MSIDTRSFPTLAVLSVTSGRLLTEPKPGDGGNGIGQMYEVLEWLTGDAPFTHQLPRFAQECRPHIWEQHPRIKEADAVIEQLCAAGKSAECQLLMRGWFGDFIELRKIPSGSHVAIDPVQELDAMTRKREDDEIERLREINAELLEALKVALDSSWNGPMPDHARDKASESIAKAERKLT